MAESVLRVEGLRKEFAIRRARPLVAVDDISFDLGAGGALGIVGESGSGKSTLARMVVGLEEPTTGTILINGSAAGPARSAADRRRRARQVQMVFQDPYTSLDPRQAIGSCLDEVVRLHSDMADSDRLERVGALLDAVGLHARVARSLPGELSGGQRQRVAIARCLASEASILVLDEAVSALDVSVQGQVLNLLAELRASSGLSYVFISHDLAVVRQVCDEVLVMRRGRCLEFGPTSEILSSPRDPYTRLLLESVPRPGWDPAQVGALRAEVDRHA